MRKLKQIEKNVLIQFFILILMALAVLIVTNIVITEKRVEYKYIDMAFSKELKDETKQKFNNILNEVFENNKYTIVETGNTNSSKRIKMEQEMIEDKYQLLKDKIEKEVDKSAQISEKKTMPAEEKWVNLNSYIVNGILVIITGIITTIIMTKIFEEKE